MNKQRLIQGLTKVIADNGVDEALDKHAPIVAKFLCATIEQLIAMRDQPSLTMFDVNETKLGEQVNKDADESVAKFVDEMYALYPTKCPKRNTSLGKSRKDKVKIKRLLKTYTKEEIERVIRHEVDSNYGVNYMKNFSTFLNNFPEPKDLPTKNVVVPMASTSDVVIVDGVIYR